MHVAPHKTCKVGMTTMLPLRTTASTFEWTDCVKSSKRIKSDLGNQTLAIPTRQGRRMSRELYLGVHERKSLRVGVTSPSTANHMPRHMSVAWHSVALRGSRHG